MNRKKSRENAFVAAFELSFRPEELETIIQDSRECAEYQDYLVDDFGEKLLRLMVQHTEEADQLVSEKLKGWQYKRLPRACQVILRLAVCEMLYGEEQNIDSVIINEAVEIAKKFTDDGNYQFINGVLGTISRERCGEATC